MKSTGTRSSNELQWRDKDEWVPEFNSHQLAPVDIILLLSIHSYFQSPRDVNQAFNDAYLGGGYFPGFAHPFRRRRDTYQQQPQVSRAFPSINGASQQYL